MSIYFIVILSISFRSCLVNKEKMFSFYFNQTADTFSENWGLSFLSYHFLLPILRQLNHCMLNKQPSLSTDDLFLPFCLSNIVLLDLIVLVYLACKLLYNFTCTSFCMSLCWYISLNVCLKHFLENAIFSSFFQIWQMRIYFIIYFVCLSFFINWLILSL